MEDKKNVYITVHKSFVREGIEYFDKKTGQMGKFNSVTLPRDTVLDGMDLSFYQFSPLFVNESRFKGEDFRDIPLLADKEVWLKRTVMDPDGNPVTDESGRPVKDTVKVMPGQLKEALDSRGSVTSHRSPRGRRAPAKAPASSQATQAARP